MSQEPKKPNPFTPWIITVATLAIFIGTFLVSPATKHYNPADNQYPIATNDYTKIDISAPMEVNSITNEKEAPSEKAKEQYAAERSDLAAQWAMAEYTFVGLGMGAIGLILIGFTYWESRKAAYFTEQALRDSQINSTRELRAYLNITANLANYYGLEKATFSIFFNNRGLTPIINIGYTIKLISGEETIASFKPHAAKMTISPDSSIREPIEVPIEALSRSDGVTCIVSCTYNDIFNGERFINQTLFIDSNNFPTLSPLDTARTGSNESLEILEHKDDLQKEAKEYAKANKT